MKTPRITHWTLAAGIGLAEIRAALGDHFSLSDVETAELQLEILDDFAWDLWQDGRILCFTADGRLELYRDDDLLEIVEVRSRPKFWWDVPDERVCHALESALGLWSLAPIATVHRRVSQFAALNQDDKTVVRVELNEVTPILRSPQRARPDDVAGNPGRLLTVCALRGYDDAACEAERHLDPLLAEPRASASLRVLLSELGIEAEPAIVKPNFDLAPDTPAELAVRRMLEDILRHARVYEDGVIADRDTEFLHQYRVSLRKARALISLMKATLPRDLHIWLKPELAALSRATGPLRDLDVLMLERERYRDMLPDVFHTGLNKLFRIITRDRTKALKAVVRSLTAPDYSKRYEAVLKRVSGTPAYQTEQARGPIEAQARKKIRQHYRKVGKRGAAIDAETPAELVHELRIECKKLRYLMEFFAGLFPASHTKPAIKSLKGLQDVLGAFNDYSVQQQFFLDLASRRKLPGDVSHVVSGLVAVLHQRRNAERIKLQTAFASFQSRETAEQFDTLFQPSANGAETS